MISYKELIKDDKFAKADSYTVDTNINKMCWACETKFKAGHMVLKANGSRRIFFCEKCFNNLK